MGQPDSRKCEHKIENAQKYIEFEARRRFCGGVARAPSVPPFYLTGICTPGRLAVGN